MYELSEQEREAAVTALVQRQEELVLDLNRARGQVSRLTGELTTQQSLVARLELAWGANDRARMILNGESS